MVSQWAVFLDSGFPVSGNVSIETMRYIRHYFIWLEFDLNDIKGLFPFWFKGKKSFCVFRWPLHPQSLTLLCWWRYRLLSDFVRTLLVRARCAYIPFSVPENGMTSWRNSVLIPLVPNVSLQNFDCCSPSLSGAWKKWKVPTSHWLCSAAPGFTVLPEESGAVGGWRAQPGWAYGRRPGLRDTMVCCPQWPGWLRSSTADVSWLLITWMTPLATLRDTQE